MLGGEMGLPVVICSSVIRASCKGEAHGGLYLVDMEHSRVKQVLEYNDDNIDWSGRGGERGLRGIAFNDGKIYVASNDKVIVMSDSFDLLGMIENEYMSGCHEICIYNHQLYITSTDFDSILIYDLNLCKFVMAINIVRKKGISDKISGIFRQCRYVSTIFNPMEPSGPSKKDTVHINNVFADDRGVFVSGVRIDSLLWVQDGVVGDYVSLPYGTHNASPVHDGAMFNDTANNGMCLVDRKGEVLSRFNLPVFDGVILRDAGMDEKVARKGFARGLCRWDGGWFAGVSPATVSVYVDGRSEPVKAVNLSSDVRNAIHGLEVFPYSVDSSDWRGGNVLSV